VRAGGVGERETGADPYLDRTFGDHREQTRGRRLELVARRHIIAESRPGEEVQRDRHQRGPHPRSQP